METIIGFVAGYLAGVNDGRDGLDRMRTSLTAIRSSPEARRLAWEAASLAQSAIRQLSRGGLSDTVSGVTDLLGARATRGGRTARAA